MFELMLWIVLLILFLQVGGRGIGITVKAINRGFDNLESKLDGKKKE